MDPQTIGSSVKLSTRLDRYPAKMVSKLADRLVQTYARNAHSILDPFCGSGAILTAAQRHGVAVSGSDINPMAELFCRVKLSGFDPERALELTQAWVEKAQKLKRLSPVDWESKHFWFTPMTLKKFEALRSAGKRLELSASREGRAALLSFVLAVRLCSRADQRSPKPFISRQAREARRGRHFDPYGTILLLLKDLSHHYGRRPGRSQGKFLLADVSRTASFARRIGKHSHIITSPPYINAQDYFRNFKLELYLLEGLLPFRVDDLRERFIGTERGDLLDGVPESVLDANRRSVRQLRALERGSPRLAAVVHRYLSDMCSAFDVLRDCLAPKGKLVIVCGDNLVGGLRIRTWRVLQKLLENRGFQLFDQFADPISDRMLAPKRCGHKGLIKEEVVSAFRL